VKANPSVMPPRIVERSRTEMRSDKSVCRARWIPGNREMRAGQDPDFGWVDGRRMSGQAPTRGPPGAGPGSTALEACPGALAMPECP